MSMYDSMSEVYDSIFEKKNYELEVKQILELIPGRKGMFVLDVGCGTGSHAEFFAKDMRYTGIDINKKMIAKAQKKHPKLEFRNTSMSDFSVQFDQNYYLIVSLFNVINHIMTIDELLRFFSDIRYKLEPNGHFIFDCWNGLASILNPPDRERREYENGHLLISPQFDPFEQHIKVDYELFENEKLVWEDGLEMIIWTPKTISDCLKKVGFKIDNITTGFGKQDFLSPASPSDYKLLYHCRK